MASKKNTKKNSSNKSSSKKDPRGRKPAFSNRNECRSVAKMYREQGGAATAEHYGVSLPTVLKAVRRAGREVRPRGTRIAA